MLEKKFGVSDVLVNIVKSLRFDTVSRNWGEQLTETRVHYILTFFTCAVIVSCVRHVEGVGTMYVVILVRLTVVTQIYQEIGGI